MILKCNKDNKELVLSFFNKLPHIKTISDEILEHAIFSFEENINAIISYVHYNDVALIKYFIFEKNVNFSVLEELFKVFLENIDPNITKIITVINNDTLTTFFEKLGFTISNENIFILDEQVVSSFVKVMVLLPKKT